MRRVREVVQGYAALSHHPFLSISTPSVLCRMCNLTVLSDEVNVEHDAESERSSHVLAASTNASSDIPLASIFSADES